MSELNRVDTTLLEVIAGMKDGKAEGAFNIRKISAAPGASTRKSVTYHENRKPGIECPLCPRLQGQLPYPGHHHGVWPRETVYNDFYVGEGCGRHDHCRLRHPQLRLGRFRARRRAYVLRRQKRPRQVR